MTREKPFTVRNTQNERKMRLESTLKNFLPAGFIREYKTSTFRCLPSLCAKLVPSHICQIKIYRVSSSLQGMEALMKYLKTI